MKINRTVPIPTQLLLASRSPDEYFEAIRAFMRRHDCDNLSAWAYLEADLAEYGLPGRYSSPESFKRGKNYHFYRKKR